jgi:hypothetical protein
MAANTPKPRKPPPKAPPPPDPSILGSGMAAQAGETITARRKALDAAIKAAGG